MYAELKRMCNRCGESKDLNNFYKNLTKERRCKQCVSLLRKEAYKVDPTKVISRVTQYRKQNPEKIKDTKLKQTYGVGLDWFKTKLKEQNDVCACCKKAELMIWRRKNIALSVDHDHKTGKVRGLLCAKCNWAVGFIEENPDRVQKMLAYLEKFKK